jgi:hypothetical protein
MFLFGTDAKCDNRLMLKNEDDIGDEVLLAGDDQLILKAGGFGVALLIRERDGQ